MSFPRSLRFSNGGISAMRARIRISSLIPSGLVIESVSDSVTIGGTAMGAVARNL